jgi:hypothetical protein
MYTQKRPAFAGYHLMLAALIEARAGYDVLETKLSCKLADFFRGEKLPLKSSAA